jgi:hypothetical protein
VSERAYERASEKERVIERRGISRERVERSTLEIRERERVSETCFP